MADQPLLLASGGVDSLEPQLNDFVAAVPGAGDSCANGGSLEGLIALPVLALVKAAGDSDKDVLAVLRSVFDLMRALAMSAGKYYADA